ncbi:hypothetical protein K1I94_04025 [Streptococcus sanguinis]|uniref:hypothetical protein n=1 Tax=Streptococcus sanguinis TaxID=1305 RepID=UPI001CBDA042|nr:hypothetical protein [Streptococcus sanguinis]MBZ2066060.1 hypothetical protein [Streptococcus sanguinis]
MVKKGKIATLSIVALTATLVIGGTIMSVQNKSLFTNRTTQEKKKEQDPREKQLAYLKEHEEEIKEFVKSQNPKIDSVQIDWDQTQWDQIGNGTPQGGGDIIDIYGTFNNIEDSGWHVMVNVEDEKIDLDSMTLVNGLGIGGKPFE